MRCPACKEPMIVLELESVEVDYCVACEGVWLDAGELEALFGDVEACEAFMTGGDLARSKGEKPRRCPTCGARMRKGVAGGEAPVTYDQCPKGDGVWFDKGELGVVVSHGHSHDRTGRVSGFLRDVFSAPKRP